MTPQEDTYLSVARAAVIMGVSTRTIMRWIYAEAHPLPAVQVGKAYYIPARAFTAWRTSKAVTP